MIQLDIHGKHPLAHREKASNDVNVDLNSLFAPEPVLWHTQATGFALFGKGHLASLAASLVLETCLVRAYLRLPRTDGLAPSEPRRRMLRAISGTAVGLVAAKCACYLALGLFEPLFWPLHVCNLCEFVALAYALDPRSPLGRRMADLLFCWGLTGCLGALLLPGWHGYCPAPSLASICGFLEHALVFACALCPLVGGDYAPQLRRMWFVLLVTVAGGAFFRLVNPLLGTNFFFVTNPAAVGGPFAWLVATFGDPGFLVPYLGIAVASWAFAHGIYQAVVRTSGRHA